MKVKMKKRTKKMKKEKEDLEQLFHVRGEGIGLTCVCIQIFASMAKILFFSIRANTAPSAK